MPSWQSKPVPKVSKLCRAAKGSECTVQLFPYCTWLGTETVVLAHAPSELKGMGSKSPDWWGADACAACHDLVDGRQRVSDITGEEIYRAHIRGVFRTILRRIEGGLIIVAD